MASLRARLTWQARKRGQVEPRQLSRVEVTSGHKEERSSKPVSSAMSPLRVDCAQVSILAKAFCAPGWADSGLCRACSMRCRHK